MVAPSGWPNVVSRKKQLLASEISFLFCWRENSRKRPGECGESRTVSLVGSASGRKRKNLLLAYKLQVHPASAKLTEAALWRFSFFPVYFSTRMLAIVIHQASSYCDSMMWMIRMAGAWWAPGERLVSALRWTASGYLTRPDIRRSNPICSPPETNTEWIAPVKQEIKSRPVRLRAHADRAFRSSFLLIL